MLGSGSGSGLELELGLGSGSGSGLGLAQLRTATLRPHSASARGAASRPLPVKAATRAPQPGRRATWGRPTRRLRSRRHESDAARRAVGSRLRWSPQRAPSAAARQSTPRRPRRCARRTSRRGPPPPRTPPTRRPTRPPGRRHSTPPPYAARSAVAVRVATQRPALKAADSPVQVPLHAFPAAAPSCRRLRSPPMGQIAGPCGAWRRRRRWANHRASARFARVSPARRKATRRLRLRRLPPQCEGRRRQRAARHRAS